MSNINNGNGNINHNNKNTNTKMILCKNYLQHGRCDFNRDCNYAHGVSDQQLTDLRRKVYELINSVKKSQFKLTTKYLYLNDAIEDELLILTKLCKKCQEGTCFGGLNCKKGAYNKNYLICKSNLISLNCKMDDCPMIHLREISDDEKYNSDDENNQNNNQNKFNEICNKYDKYFEEVEEKEKEKEEKAEIIPPLQLLSEDEYFNLLSSESSNSNSSNFDSDELTYLYESSSSDDIYASIFD